MTSPPRPPPKVLFVHDGIPYEAHMKHLADAGLVVTEAHATVALLRATAIQPDIIVLDFDCDGEITAQLKGDGQTQHIPIIALASLGKPAMPSNRARAEGLAGEGGEDDGRAAPRLTDG